MTVGLTVSTTKLARCAGVRGVAALVDDAGPGHVEAAHGAGQGGELAAGADVIGRVGQGVGVGNKSRPRAVDSDADGEIAVGVGERRAGVGADDRAAGRPGRGRVEVVDRRRAGRAPTAMPTSTIAVWPARGTSTGLGSVIDPMKLGRFVKVTKSPTILLSLVGCELERSLGDDRGRGVDDEVVVEVAARIAVAGGERQLNAGVGVVVVGQVLAVKGDALRAGEHLRAAALQDQPVGVGGEREPAAAQVDRPACWSR